MYYLLSIYINSEHEFDKVFSSVLYNNVQLTNTTHNITTASSKYYQINTLALLYKINECIDAKDYKNAILYIDNIITQHQNHNQIKLYFIIRKGLVGMLMCKTYDEYKLFLSKNLDKHENVKQLLLEKASEYYLDKK